MSALYLCTKSWSTHSVKSIILNQRLSKISTMDYYLYWCEKTTDEQIQAHVNFNTKQHNPMRITNNYIPSATYNIVDMSTYAPVVSTCYTTFEDEFSDPEASLAVAVVLAPASSAVLPTLLSVISNASELIRAGPNN